MRRIRITAFVLIAALALAACQNPNNNPRLGPSTAGWDASRWDAATWE